MAFVPFRTPVPLVQRLAERLQPYREAHPEPPSLAHLYEWLARVVGYSDAHAAQQAARKALISRQDLPLLPGVSPRRLKEWAKAGRKAWPGPSAQDLWATLWGHATWGALCQHLLATQEAPSGYVITDEVAKTQHALPGIRWLGQAVDGRWWGIEPQRIGCHAMILGPETARLALVNPWLTCALEEGQHLWWWGLSTERACSLRDQVLDQDPAAAVWWGDFTQPGQPQPSFEAWTSSELALFQHHLMRPLCRQMDFQQTDRETLLWGYLQNYFHAVTFAIKKSNLPANLSTLAALWQSPHDPMWEGVSPETRQSAEQAAQQFDQLWQDQWAVIAQHWQILAQWFDLTRSQPIPSADTHALWIGPTGDTPQALGVRQALMEWAWPERFRRLSLVLDEDLVGRAPARHPRELWWMEGESADDWLGSVVPIRLAQARGMGISLMWTIDEPLRHHRLPLEDQAAWWANVSTCVHMMTAPAIEAELVLSNKHKVRLAKVGLTPG